jgi:hypothetical protein
MPDEMGNLVRSFLKILIGGIALLALFAGCCGGLTCTYYSWNEGARRKEQKVHQDKEDELKSFAQRDLPELQELIDEMGREITSRTERLTELANQLRRFDKDPTADPDYIRWEESLAQIRKQREELLNEREEAFIAAKKYELSQPLHETPEERENRLRQVRKSVEESRSTFKKLLDDMEKHPLFDQKK